MFCDPEDACLYSNDGSALQAVSVFNLWSESRPAGHLLVLALPPTVADLADVAESQTP